MGLLSAYSNVLLSILALGPSSNQLQNQQPLPLGDIALHHETSVDVVPEIASSDFTCQYPNMKGWVSCNAPDSRDCWLQDTNSDQPLFSQYESVLSDGK